MQRYKYLFNIEFRNGIFSNLRDKTPKSVVICETFINFVVSRGLSLSTTNNSRGCVAYIILQHQLHTLLFIYPTLEECTGVIDFDL